ncbi:hypothetical protein SAMN05216223_1305 [Actinacidiphila yanglinensis]|uniref:Phage or prophage related protein n=1 Tax=Actinacidiphila yanglinensis TaxID=310779 RepID=A0A1H6E9H4_9ACTN|nr:hypothetical protein [Actinacidiphila yanglinensis]SEG94342.1 hypothetical protein SAMN05216223_1305 [Actinacidiphila yanglinensis]
MARIRTIKPEAFASESLAAVSLSAERTFFGLLTQADDHGRFRDQPAVIAGLLWSLRPDHGPIGVEDDLTQLAAADLVCRYEGQDGKRYLHVVSWHRHQKINRPSGNRAPACPHHDDPTDREPSPRTHRALPEDSGSPHGQLPEGYPHPGEPSPIHEPAGQSPLAEPSVTPHGGLSEAAVIPHGPDLGPRILDLGSVPAERASAPPPPPDLPATASDLVGEYIAACAHRPPKAFLAQLCRAVERLLAEGIAPAHVRPALERLRVKGLSTSVLPSLVNEAMNAISVQPNTRPRHRAWTNPADVESAYGGEL